VKLADLSDIEEAMSKAVEATQRAFNTIRTGRANSSLLDKVMVEYYGTPTPLKSLANISIPDASTLTIQPFDPGSLTDIERAISLSDIGLTPNNDGKLVRLNIPPLTNERRKEFVKLASKYAEEGGSPSAISAAMASISSASRRKTAISPKMSPAICRTRSKA
jgi:ribosome recycling factor